MKTLEATALAGHELAHESVHLGVLNAQDEVDHDSGQQGNGQNSRAEAVVEAALTTTPDTLGTPVECNDRINHGGHGDDGEQGGGDAANAVTEVQQTNGQAAQDDGEVQPREKGSLVGEEDLGLDTGGQSNPLTWK